MVHIARRKRWEEVAEAEQALDDDEPVTAPTANRSGERKSFLQIIGTADLTRDAVHIDQSYCGAELVRDSKLEEFPQAEAEKLKKSRWAIVNLWRPFDVVTRDKMALCDARTAEESDLVAVYAELSENSEMPRLDTTSQPSLSLRHGRSRQIQDHINGTMQRI